MRNNIKWFTASLFFFFLGITVSPAAQETGRTHGTATPAAAVRTMLDQVMAVQTDLRLQGRQHRDERRLSIKDIIARNFYFDGMSRLALGNYRDKLSKSEMADFNAIFQDLFQDSYTKLVADFLKQEKIIYGKEEMKQNNALVKTKIVRMNEEIPVDYSLVLVQGKWLVQDVTIDGVSITDNYRLSFTRVIQRGSFKVLLNKMRTQQKAIEK
jgi:phospholipid transport system substrate-binding protein